MHSGTIRKGIFLSLFLIVPGVLYFIWYFLEGHWGCSTCGSPEVVPIVDPEAITLEARAAGKFA